LQRSRSAPHARTGGNLIAQEPPMMSFKSKARWLAVVALAGAASASSAITFLVNEIHMGNFTVQLYDDQRIPLNNSGSLEGVWFSDTGATIRVLHYSAECAAVYSQAIVTLTLNGATVKEAVRFCDGSLFGGHNRSSISVAIQPRAGDNHIMIYARPVPNSAKDWPRPAVILGDTSLMVH
jgi:hypothetical protein